MSVTQPSIPPRRTLGRPVSTRIVWPARVSLPAPSAAISVSGVTPSAMPGTSEKRPFSSAVVATSPSCHMAVTVEPGSETPLISALVAQPAAVVAASLGAVPSAVKVQSYVAVSSMRSDEVTTTDTRCGPSASFGSGSA